MCTPLGPSRLRVAGFPSDEMTEIDTWIAGCKVRAFDWIDGKSIYMNVRYYAPGQSLERAPAKERSVLIEKTPENEDRIRTHLHSVVDGIVKGAY